MRGLLAPMCLVAARARRRPGRWLPPLLGVAVAVAFAAGVLAEATIAGDQAARRVLGGLDPSDRATRVTWVGSLSPSGGRLVDGALRGPHLGPATEVLLLNEVRLDGVLVRPVAIAPLGRWLPGRAGGGLGPCRPAGCPMLLAGGGRVPQTLAASGVRIRVVGSAPLGSPVPLSFAPATSSGPPVLVTSDLAGLDALPGLSGVYRTRTRLASLRVAGLHGWQLGALETRLARVQAEIEGSASQLSVSAPFAGIDVARAQARAAPRRLLLAGGGALVALVLFIVLAGAQLRRDQRAELARLRNAGATASQSAMFVAAESGWLCAAALAVGAGLGLAIAVILADASAVPVDGVLRHGVITWQAAVALAAAWLGGTALLAGAALVGSAARTIDAAALAAVVALIATLTLNTRGDDAVAVMLAPLCCLAAGVIVFRGAAATLRIGERAVRRGPVLLRLAVVDLARSPGLPSLAIAFLAVGVGLGGFALAYRATLMRGAADQAADVVPLDATVTAGANFNTPLTVAPLDRWRSISRGLVLPVRRTDANYLLGAGTVTVPALGVPEAGLSRIHGWRESDGSAPLPVLARRLRPGGPIRDPGPRLPPSARWLAVRASSPALQLSVTADLRDPAGAIRQLVLGTTSPRARTLRARLPGGSWELEALKLDEPTGLAITNGHQNSENPAAATQGEVRVALGPVRVTGATGHPPGEVDLGSWRGVGAASGSTGSPGAPATVIAFATTGAPGVVRPPQPSDTRPVPVLADPGTAAASAPDGRLDLTVDGLPVRAVVVGTVRRFPTLPADAAGVLVADEGTLAAALDAQLPGQGRPDELWIATTRTGALRQDLKHASLAQLSWSFRRDLERELASAPIARGVQRTLIAAALVWGILGVLGLLMALLGGGRDRAIEDDLEAQGVGPRGLRSQARARVALAAVLGALSGVVIALVLTRLAVGSVRAAGTVAIPRPPLVTVIPWAQLAVWAAAAILVPAAAAWIVTGASFRSGRGRRPVRPAGRSSRLSEGIAR
jgi:hypothetical protein